MGRKDFGHKEQKKTKKDAKKILSINTAVPPPPVEVIRRGKKEKIEEEE
jgi:hypothetical protein